MVRVKVMYPCYYFPTTVKSYCYSEKQFIFEDNSYWLYILSGHIAIIFTTEHVMSYRTNTFSWKTLIRAAIKDSILIRLVECWKNFYTWNWPYEDHIWIVPLIYGDSTTLIANLFINCNWDSSQSKPPSSFVSVVPSELLRLRNMHIMSIF